MISFARMETVCRTSGRTIRDKLDYLSRKRAFAKRRDLLIGPITALPPDAPKAFRKMETLWTVAESRERMGGVMALEIVAALPPLSRMSVAECRAICKRLAEALAQEYNVAITFVVHGPTEPSQTSEEGDDNVHAHFLITSRKIGQDGFARHRDRDLLPDIVGSGWRRFGHARTLQVGDATNFQAMFCLALEHHFARSGQDYRPRIPAVIPGYHVGPVAAIGTLIDDVEAIARRPDAAAIFRKIDRLKVNSIIEERNITALRAIEPLLGHLESLIFSRDDVKTLVERYLGSSGEADGIVEHVISQSLRFVEPVNGTPSRFFVLPGYRQHEERIATLAQFLNKGWGSHDAKGNNGVHMASPLEDLLLSGTSPVLLDIADIHNADEFDHLYEALTARGQPVFYASHLNKRRAYPANAKLIPLHWQSKADLPDGSTIVVEEPDQLSLSHLEKLLETAVKCEAKVVLCRRSYRSGFHALPIIEELWGSGAVRIGASKTTSPSALVEGKTMLFSDTLGTLATLASHLHNQSIAEGRSTFFLCADPVIRQNVLIAAGDAPVQLRIGPQVPPSYEGKVIIIHCPANDGRHVAALMASRAHLIVSRSTAPDLPSLQAQLRVSMGEVTTLRDRTQPYLKGPVSTPSIAFDFDDMPVPQASVRGSAWLQQERPTQRNHWEEQLHDDGQDPEIELPDTKTPAAEKPRVSLWDDPDPPPRQAQDDADTS